MIRFIQDCIRRIYSGQVIVYSIIQLYIIYIAEQLGCLVFYCQTIDKNRILKIFRQQSGAVIAVINILNIDIDIPNIRSVIYIDQFRNILDYIQKSGRTDRDRQHSKIIIIQIENQTVDREI